jgi:hypothetical protein
MILSRSLARLGRMRSNLPRVGGWFSRHIWAGERRRPVCLGRASSGASSGWPVGVLADWLPYGGKWAKCQVGLSPAWANTSSSLSRIYPPGVTASKV